jgi:hypothetical protein
MKSILYDFACGNLSPEQRVFKKGSRYGRAMNVLSDSEEKLLSALDGELREAFKQFSEAQSEISHLSDIDKFICGYRLGVLMTMEVFNYKEGSIFGGACE